MSEPKELAQLYPQTCPFCSIAAAYPHRSASANSTNSISSSSSRDSSITTTPFLLSSIPLTPSHIDPAKVSPAAYVVLAAPRVLAFLDIMPMTRGHLLVTTRRHRRKVEELVGGGEGGSFWLPLLAKTVAAVTGVSDYNIVQNNGARAAQVVPHVHFHIIPRPASLPALQNKSWTMFGRGQREELDDAEAAALAASMRHVLRGEVLRMLELQQRRERRGRRKKMGGRL
ncbi:HIT-like domain-containing protein [Phyllosticta citrichinensis]|uniref:HIT-like domain-containing protein n=1 Tax=Phyllosticta citrichinensis TaxID=1130410 RepID=A0ABR1XUY6_9PEZI